MKKIIHKTVKDGRIIKGTIPVYIKNNEYINMYPFLKKECEWFTIIDKNVNFDTEQIFNINYEIDTQKINSSFERAIVVLDEIKEKKAIIDVFIIPDFLAEISKYSFSYADEGEIRIKNNIKSEFEVDAFASESYLKFEDKIKAENEIILPFSIKMPILLKTQMEISSKPYNEVSIFIKIKYKDKIMNKKFNITIGCGFVD